MSALHTLPRAEAEWLCGRHPSDPHPWSTTSPVRFAPPAAPALGWDVHIAPPGAGDHSQGSHTLPDDDGILRYRVCTTDRFLHGADAVDAHGGARLPTPFHLDRHHPTVELALVDGSGNRHHVLTLEHGALFDNDVSADVYGNRLERQLDTTVGPYPHLAVRVTAPHDDSLWARLLLEAGTIVAIQVPAPH